MQRSYVFEFLAMLMCDDDGAQVIRVRLDEEAELCQDSKAHVFGVNSEVVMVTVSIYYTPNKTIG